MKRYSKQKALLLGVISVFVLGTGCKKQLDINTDPNNPSFDQGSPKLVFPAAVMATGVGIGVDFNVLGGIWAEYYTQSATSNQYKFIDAYNVKSTDLSSSTSSPYVILFSRGLKNYQFVINQAKAAKDWNFNLMATVMKAYTAEVLVDAYDQIPYSEALQGSSNLNPKFDDGYSIYKDLLSNLDSSLNQDFSASSNTILKGSSSAGVDLVFKGDINSWKLFNNTLQLKMYLRMINAKPDEAKAGVQKLYNRSAGFLTTDASITGFTDAPGLDNPFFEQNRRQLNTPDNLRASATFVSWLEANNDPRIVSYFGKTTPDFIHQGDNTGTNASYKTSAVFVQSPSDPVQFISAAESYFLQAEASVRYFNGTQAKALYDQGVQAAFAQLGLNAAPFIAAGGAYAFPSNGTPEQKIQAIIVQKWASLAYGTHSLEAWFERNRTGYPVSSPVYSDAPSYVPGQIVVAKNSVLAPGQYPKRLVFPDLEVSRNVNTPAQVAITTPVWWGK